jgi:hypothetical protein
MGTPRDARPIRLALSPNEAAQALGVSRDHLDRHIAPELAWTYSGRRKFVSVRELERYLAESACRPLAQEVSP